MLPIHPARGLLLGTPLALGCGPLELPATCGVSATPIADVQGVGAVSPYAGRWLSVEGGVSVAASVGARAGFFLQAVPAAADSPASQALFVALDEGVRAPTAGTRVQVRGRVEELEGVTALASVELLEECGRAPLEPQRVELGLDADVERWEGMWLRSSKDLTLIDTSELASEGRVSVSAQGRLYAPGHPLGQPETDTAYELWRLEGLGERARGWLDSGGSAHLRLGAQLRGLEALVVSATPPTLLATSAVDFRAPAAPAPAPPGTALRVAALNLGNYFAAPGTRGARTEAEHVRQREKLVGLLRQLDADILALSELGDASLNAASDDTSLSDLLTALNATLPAELAYTGSEATSNGSGVHSALAHRPGRLRSSGAAWALPSPAFRRAPLFQSFEVASGVLSVGVVHLKSKLCDGAELVGPEGCGAAQRLDEARALVSALATLPAQVSELVLLIGDFNADALESPLLELKRAGLVDLFDALPPAERYTYVFDGRVSQLDHALATPALLPALTGASVWHVNADEPEWLGYRYEPTSELADARRSSDHDPIVVDFSL